MAETSKESVVYQEQTHSPTASKIGQVLAVMSGKGGVGKSSITGLLASSLRRRDFQVGVLDADITGPSIPKSARPKRAAATAKSVPQISRDWLSLFARVRSCYSGRSPAFCCRVSALTAIA
jgi:Mrp family chromosome partitioning ATPase